MCFQVTQFFLILSISLVSAASERGRQKKIHAKLFENSNCSNTPAHKINSGSRCDILNSSVRIRGIKIKGQCHSVSESLPEACRLAKVIALDPQNAFYESGQDCKPEDFVGPFSDATSCDNLNSSKSIYQLKIKGKCKKISGTNIKRACELAKVISIDPQNAFYRSGYDCKPEEFVSPFSDSMNCEDLTSNHSIYQLKVKGKCTKISGTNFENACKLFKIISADRQNAFYRSGYDCKPEEFIKAFHPKMDCENLGSSDRVYQIKTRGKCSRISGTGINEACRVAKVRFLHPSVAIYSGKNCTPENFIAPIYKQTVCDRLKKPSSTYQLWLQTLKSCKQQSESDIVDVCKNAKTNAEGVGHSDKLYADTDCKKPEAVVSMYSNCSSGFDSSLSLKGFSVNGSCWHYKSSQDAGVVCRAYKKRTMERYNMKFFFKNSSCQPEDYIASLSVGSSCQELKGRGTGEMVKSVFLNGTCSNLKSGADLGQACLKQPKEKVSEGQDENCWEQCIDDGNSTQSCVRKCKVRDEDERNTCLNYCSGRGGNSSLCSRLCK